MKTSLADMTLAVLSANEWTETELAKRLGVSQPHVNRMKRGQVTRPSYELVVALRDLFEQIESRPAA